MCVRSSTEFYFRFNLDMGRSPGFGSTVTDSLALLRLGFPSAPHLQCLTLPATVTRRTVLQKVRGRAINALPQFVNTGFQVLFHSPPGVLFTFPSQYYALSVTKEYLALGGGPPDFPQGSTCLVVLWIPLAGYCFRVPLIAVHNPGMHASRFRLLPFRSPLLWKSMFLSFPPAT